MAPGKRSASLTIVDSLNVAVVDDDLQNAENQTQPQSSADAYQLPDARPHLFTHG
jgi:hypothetical protein